MESVATLLIAIAVLITIIVIYVRDQIAINRALNQFKQKRAECKHENWKYIRRCEDCGLHQVWDKDANTYKDVEK